MCTFGFTMKSMEEMKEFKFSAFMFFMPFVVKKAEQDNSCSWKLQLLL